MPGVANYLIRRLRDAGTRTLFGLPGGGGNLDLIDAAGRAGLPFVLTATETGSAIAALAQAEITGAAGACLTTIGPGAASVVNGVACAHLDRAAVLVITDRYPESQLTFEHQQIDHRALLSPVTKWTGALTPDHAFETVDRAFAHLTTLPPGPVHLDCPGDFEQAVRGNHEVAINAATAAADAADFSLCTRARKPLLIVGLGARQRQDADAIRKFCRTTNVPALVTYKGKGIVPDDDACFAGVFTHAAIERTIVSEADLLIGVGFDPVEILPRPWTYTQPIMSIARWEMADEHVPFRVQWVGDIAHGLGVLASALPASEWDLGRVRTLVESQNDLIAGYAGSKDPASYRHATPGLTPQRAVQLAAERFGGAARVTVDAGAHMFPATTLWPVGEPSGMLISNGLSTMGFALPAAIGAALLDRERPVVALTGDGGLLICLGELATAVRERLKIITIVFNDSSLTLIELKQQQRKLAPAGVGLGDFAWAKIAAGFGMPAWTAATERELEAAIELASGIDGPSLIEARIDRANYGRMLKVIRG